MNLAEIALIGMFMAVFALGLTVAYAVCMQELRAAARPATGQPRRRLYIYDLRHDWQKGKKV